MEENIILVTCTSRTAMTHTSSTLFKSVLNETQPWDDQRLNESTSYAGRDILVNLTCFVTFPWNRRRGEKRPEAVREIIVFLKLTQRLCEVCQGQEICWPSHWFFRMLSCKKCHRWHRRGRSIVSAKWLSPKWIARENTWLERIAGTYWRLS